MKESRFAKFHNKTPAELIALYLGIDEYECDHAKSDFEQIEEFCNANGIFKYEERLIGEWWKIPTCVLVVERKADHKLFVLNPDTFNRYRYYDEENDRQVLVTEKCAQEWNDVVLYIGTSFNAGKITSRDILRYCLESWTLMDYLVIILLTLISVAFGLFLPKLNYILFANAVPGGSISFLIGTTLFIIAANFGKLFCSALHSFLSSYLSGRTDALASSTLMVRILSLPMDAFNKFSSGELVERIHNADSICQAFTTAVFVYALSCLFSLSYFLEISRYNSSLILPSVIAIAFQTAISILIMKKSGKHEEQVIEATMENKSMTLAMITGMQKLKLTGAEDKAYDLWEKSFQKGLDVYSNPPFIVKFSGAISIVLSSLVSIAIYSIVGYANMQVADFFAFQTAFGLVYGVFGSLQSLMSTMTAIEPSMAAIEPLLAIETEVNPKSEAVGQLDGTIRMEHVYFRYDKDSPYILEDFSVDIKKGEYVAIVGKTGCGKSTLVKTLLGFETPEKGQILYNGKNLQKLEKRSVRKHIGTVLQNTQLFSGSILENLRLCAPMLSEEDAWGVAELVDMKDDIMAMPMRMHTLISEGGGGISGGQVQRLAIGRAIAQRPEILILDEATSALDNISQNKICRSLDQFQSTRLVIAHRLSTIKNCNRIIMLDQGRIIEDGTYEELIAKRGVFAELVRRQQLELEGNDAI